MQSASSRVQAAMHKSEKNSSTSLGISEVTWCIVARRVEGFWEVLVDISLTVGRKTETGLTSVCADLSGMSYPGARLI